MAAPFEWDSIFCNFCRIKVASIDDCVAPYLSTHVFEPGRVAIYNRVFNVHNVNKHRERFGADVTDTNCSQCGQLLGWKFIQLEVENNLYRAGRFILKLDRIRYSPDDDEDVEEGGDSNEENVDQDLDGNGLNADQHGVANEQDIGANEPNANHDLGANEQVPKEPEVGINEPNAEQDLKNNQQVLDEQNLAATEQKADQDGANNQVQQDLGANEQNADQDGANNQVQQDLGANEQNADQDGGVNEQTDDDKDGGQPTKRRKIN